MPEKRGLGRATEKANASRDPSATILPADVHDLLVTALAEALVLDFQEDTKSMVVSPGGNDHNSEAGST